MNSRNLMTAIAIVTGLVGVASLIVPAQITSQVFPSLALGEEAMMVGVFHRQVVGGCILIASIYCWFMRDAEQVIASRFLFATGLAFSLNALVLIKASIIDGVTGLPYPPFIILVIFAIASFYVSKKASD